MIPPAKSYLQCSFQVFLFCITLWESGTEAKKVELRDPRAEEEPLCKQFITLLQPVSPLPLMSLSPTSSLSIALCSYKTPRMPSSPPNSSSVSPLHGVVSQSLTNPGGKSFGSVLAYGYLTSASPIIRLSSLNDATCGATNATKKSIKA